jgi:SNF2 family DNA or RNA helicase
MQPVPARVLGINLTQANRVFLIEPALNAALEAQAIGRVHRLGQKRQVEIIRLIVKDSIETRILQKNKPTVVINSQESIGHHKEVDEAIENESTTTSTTEDSRLQLRVTRHSMQELLTRIIHSFPILLDTEAGS